MKFSLIFLLFLGLTACQTKQNNTFPAATPSPLEATNEGKILEDSLKRKYLEELYFAAPGLNVDSLRYENWKRNYAEKMARKRAAGDRSAVETFANGLITGIWHERGPSNEAGDLRVIDFVPETEAFYVISTEGQLWKGQLDGQNWQLLNDDIRFQTEEIEVLPHNTGQRIFAAYGSGQDNKKIRFSDDEGQTWTTGTGFTFYDHWGKGRRLYALSNNQTLYYLVHTWQLSPWGQVVQLYKSNDKGVTYTKIWNSPVGYDVEDVDLWKPYDSDQMYLVDNLAQNYYQVTHNMGTGATTISSPVSYSSQGVTTGGIHISGRWNAGANAYELFAAHDDNQNIYKTLDGATWTMLSTAPENVWVKGWLADPDNTNLYLGGFQLNKSSDGVIWKEQYTQWWEYYKNSPTQKDSMHVDIMNLEYFKKSNGTPFIIILNHAGIHVTYNHFQTTKNLGLNNLNVVTLYDQTTASDGFVYCGAQDKGNFKYGGNSLADFNTFSTDNMSTGDGMLGVFFNNEQSFFAMIQNGGMMCFRNRNNNSYSGYNIPGTNKPGWINPMVPTPDPADNKAYVAGGNLNGGSGSYLITANVNISGVDVVWQNTQFNYDFRANSANGTSVIKAIGVSESNYNRIYVATQDATFFSTSDQGQSWTKHTTAGLPSTMIPWDIKVSKNNPDKVFICGTGSSNTGVYQSLNGGATFTPLSGGAPLATFLEVALSENELFLFAATTNGPYVYVFGTGQWYSLLGADSPIVNYNTVDILNNNIVRFATYGRGIWDLEITNNAAPVDLTGFDVKLYQQDHALLSWSTASEYNMEAFDIEYSTDGLKFKSVGSQAVKGISGGGAQYQWVHAGLVSGVNYYRLKMREKDGKYTYSAVKSVEITKNQPAFAIWPNTLPQNAQFRVLPSHESTYTFELFDLNGQSLINRTVSGPLDLTADLPRGTYVYQIRYGRERLAGRLVVY